MRKIKMGSWIKIGAVQEPLGYVQPRPGTWQVVSDKPLTVFAPCNCCDWTEANCYRVDPLRTTKNSRKPKNAKSIRIIYGGTRSDDYAFLAIKSRSGFKIKAGCRIFNNFEDARAHWKATRSGTKLGKESFALLRNIEKQMIKLKWIKPPKKSKQVKKAIRRLVRKVGKARKHR